MTIASDATAHTYLEAGVCFECKHDILAASPECRGKLAHEMEEDAYI